MAQLKKGVRSKYSIYEITHILIYPLLTKHLINELFMENKINQKVKEQNNLFINNYL